ncbi:MAG: hypothetical protein RR911_01005 [Oscillospiraceae bacterium]
MKITSNKVFENGKTELLLCERCNQLVNMQIIKSTSAFGALGFSLYNYKVEYFILCPKCSALYAVAPEAVQLAESKTQDISEICETKITFIKDLNIKQ